MFSEETLTALRQQVNLVELIGSTVTLKKAGSSYKGLCPFHDEKTPSFQVSPLRGRYHCFGCGASGDAIQFLCESEHLGFRDAVVRLAERANFPLPEERQRSPEERARRREARAWEDQLLAAQEELTQYYERQLQRSPEAQRYLQARGLSPETAAAFRFGWAGGDARAFAQWMRRSELSPKVLLGIGALSEAAEGRRGEEELGGLRLRFRRRLMCPIFDLRSRVLGYSGRVIDPERKIAKYLNTPETELFTKGAGLFGLRTALPALRKGAQLILCEGNLDVAALWQAGFKGAVAAMGTALTEQQAQLLYRLSPTLLCVMDGDAAGQRAAFKALPHFLRAGLQVRSVKLPEGQDPDSFLRGEGGAALQQLIERAPPLLDQRIEAAASAERADLLGRRAALTELSPLLELISDDALRQLYQSAVAERLGLPLELILGGGEATPEKEQPRSAYATQKEPWSRRETRHQSGRRSPGAARPSPIPLPPQEPLAGAPEPLKLPGVERQGLQLLTQYPAYLPRARAAELEGLFSDPRLQGFLASLYEEWDEHQRVTGRVFFERCEDRALSAALQDCFADPIRFGSESERERAFDELNSSLQQARLTERYQRCIRALVEAEAGSERREGLQRELQLLSERLRSVFTSDQPQSAEQSASPASSGR